MLDNLLEAGFQNGPGKDNLVEDIVNLVDVENEIKLAHILKALVQGLDEDLDQVQDPQFTLSLVNGKDKEEGGVVAVNEAAIGAPGKIPLDKVTHRVGALGYELVALAGNAVVVSGGDIGIELVQANLSMNVNDLEGMCEARWEKRRRVGERISGRRWPSSHMMIDGTGGYKYSSIQSIPREIAEKARWTYENGFDAHDE